MQGKIISFLLSYLHIKTRELMQFEYLSLKKLMVKIVFELS